MLTLMFLSASAVSVPIHVGRFEAASFPNATKIERRMPHEELTRRVENILARRQCSLEGQHKGRFEITVPYAVKMEASGAAAQVVVKDIGCAPIERLVGEVAVELSKAGDFKATHKDGTRWYVSEVYFARLSQYEARHDEDPDKVICQASKPIVGSRIAMRRVCKTAAEWEVFDKDRAQLRRDLNTRADPKSF